MSCPAQNASPAPVSTSTCVSGSPDSSSSASSISRWSCGLMALRLSGRFMISQVMPSLFSIRTVSYFLDIPFSLLALLFDLVVSFLRHLPRQSDRALRREQEIDLAVGRQRQIGGGR